MARTTSEQVGLIIEVDAAISLTPFIDSANDLVTELCLGSGYTDVRLELIERWLAAHFYAIRDMRAASEGAGPVNVSYQFQLGLNLASTMYGQQAMLLDTAGNLAGLSKKTEQGKKRTVGVTYLGTART